jgi:uncharacterized protein YgbK (DUF1537 family)
MTKGLLLGCIADDFTGASDLANTLAKEGMRTTQLIGTPPADRRVDCEAAVVSLKSRSIPAAQAVEQSLEALRWLQAQGAQQFLFKYCSTFDSTAEGNIGPVAEALAAALDTHAVVVCPAFPTTGRTLYQGHLFVFDKLLNESGLENHPLNPMTDADIRRWLAAQCQSQPGHVDHAIVSSGSTAIEKALAEHAAENTRLVVVDAIVDNDLRAIGSACANARLLTGGSGIALGLPENFRRNNQLSSGGDNFHTQSSAGAILCGSCSEATRRQINTYDGPHFPIDAPSLMDGTVTASSVAEQLPANEAPLIYSSADPETIKKLQSTYGTDELANKIESFFGALAVRLVEEGRRRIVVAGGETSGAVISALNLTAFNIGPEIDPGVPALSTTDNTLAVALKSGNFGSGDFFKKALAVLQGD